MKKMFLAFAALAVAMGVFAFSNRHMTTESQTEQPVWYILKTGGNPDNPADYTMATTGQIEDCEGDLNVCAIYAVPNVNNSNRPRFDATKTHDQLLIQEINESQAGDTPNASFVLERN